MLIEMTRMPAPDDAAHLDGLLMHDLSAVNARIGRYVLGFLDADAGRVVPITAAEERALADQLEALAVGIRNRAARLEQIGDMPERELREAT